MSAEGAAFHCSEGMLEQVPKISGRTFDQSSLEAALRRSSSSSRSSTRAGSANNPPLK